MTEKKTGLPNFMHFLPEIRDELENVSDLYLDSYNDHQAFVYLIAQSFETTDEKRFNFTDRSKDGGIDFFVQDSPLYSIYQCKCPDLQIYQNKPGSHANVPKFDQTCLEELIAAVEMLLDKSGNYDVHAAIKRLRGDYQRDFENDKESTNLIATLAVLGELTDQAQSAFESFRSTYARRGVSLRLVDWTNLYQIRHVQDTPQDVDVTFDVTTQDKAKDLLHHQDYCYVLAHAIDFYEAFREHEWNLFDWNVRLQVPNSPINKRIIQTLKTRKGRKKFHHLNNGILITCKQYEGVNRSDNRLTVKGAQIINGCQTVRAICEAYEDLSPEEQKEFREDARVQVKIIKNTDQDFISELVISTNDQNPMKPRNLKSNSVEQRDIQNNFRNLSHKWFYERKDGEWASLNNASSRVRRFRKSDYTVGREGKGRRQFRHLDNEKLAKAWYAFIGYSHRALTGGVDYFGDEGGRVYSIVFRSIPSPAFWSAFREMSFTAKEEYFVPATPTAYQYLLAYGIAEYIDSRKISNTLSRKITIEKGIKEGSLKGDLRSGNVLSSSNEVDAYLDKDIEYNVNKMLVYMREVLIELFSFVLTLRYVTCDAVTCQKIVSLPAEGEYFRQNFDSGILPRQQNGTALLGVIYEFLKDCARQYYYANQAEIRAAPRLRAYLAQRTTINKFRQLIVQRDETIRDWDAPWKTLGETFLDSLPELPT